MLLRSSKSPRPWSWHYLPPETRAMILGAITRAKYAGWGSHAAVCKEWQAVLESANFRKIKLSVPCLRDAELMVRPQGMGLIRHIYFEIELPPYESSCCTPGRVRRLRSSSGVVSDGLSRLLEVLSTWKPVGSLVLELNAYSPSDKEHWFQHLYFASDEVDDSSTDNASLTSLLPHDPSHGWFEGWQVQSPGSRDNSIFERLLLVLDSGTAPAEAVTCLTIRRQLRRIMSASMFGYLLDFFPRLEKIYFEPWESLAWFLPINTRFTELSMCPAVHCCCCEFLPQTSPAAAFCSHRFTTDGSTIEFVQLVNTKLPSTLNSLTLFQDSSTFYDTIPNVMNGSFEPSFDRNTRGELGAALATRSLYLQHMSISYVSDAVQVLGNCSRCWGWARLETLALTTRLMDDCWDDGWDQHGVLDVWLRRAGSLASKMPRLRNLVIWYGKEGRASAFIYRMEGNRASITWRGTWMTLLTDDLIQTWEYVASKWSSHTLEVHYEKIDKPIYSHADAIYYLDLPCQVVDPASLWQMRREARYRRV